MFFPSVPVIVTGMFPAAVPCGTVMVNVDVGVGMTEVSIEDEPRLRVNAFWTAERETVPAYPFSGAIDMVAVPTFPLNPVLIITGFGVAEMVKSGPV